MDPVLLDIEKLLQKLRGQARGFQQKADHLEQQIELIKRGQTDLFAEPEKGSKK